MGNYFRKKFIKFVNRCNTKMRIIAKQHLRNSFKIAVIGTGNMASEMVNTINSISDAVCITVVSSSLERARGFAKKHSICSFYDNCDRMLEKERVDLVYIATLNKTHKELATACIKHRIPVLVEKPICLSMMEYDELVKLSEEEQVPVFEAMLLRYSKLAKMVKDIINEGGLGKPLSLRANLGILMPDLERIHTSELGGGSFFDLGVYLIALGDFLFGNRDLKTNAIQRIEMPKLHRRSVYGVYGEDLSNDIEVTYNYRGIKVSCLYRDSVQEEYENNAVLQMERGQIEIKDVYNISKIIVSDESGVREYSRGKESNGYDLEIIGCMYEVTRWKSV